MLELERSLMARVGQSQADESHGLKAITVEREIARRETITTEQAKALTHITLRPGSVQVVSGMAGTGKTFLLQAARECWERDGYRVLGVALAGKAAKGLEEGSGIESRTCAKFLMDLQPGELTPETFEGKEFRSAAAKQKYAEKVLHPNLQLDRRTVVMVDEAGMLDTRTTEAVIRPVLEAGGKVVLVGDARQLQPIEAGGPFRAVGEAVGAAESPVVPVRTAIRPQSLLDVSCPGCGSTQRSAPMTRPRSSAVALAVFASLAGWLVLASAQDAAKKPPGADAKDGKTDAPSASRFYEDDPDLISPSQVSYELDGREVRAAGISPQAKTAKHYVPGLRFAKPLFALIERPFPVRPGLPTVVDDIKPEQDGGATLSFRVALSTPDFMDQCRNAVLAQERDLLKVEGLTQDHIKVLPWPLKHCVITAQHAVTKYVLGVGQTDAVSGRKEFAFSMRFGPAELTSILDLIRRGRAEFVYGYTYVGRTEYKGSVELKGVKNVKGAHHLEKSTMDYARPKASGPFNLNVTTDENKFDVPTVPKYVAVGWIIRVE